MYSSRRFLMLLQHTMLRHYINMIPVKSCFLSILCLLWNIKFACPSKCGFFSFSSPAWLPGFQSPGYSPTWSQNILNDMLPWRTHKNNETLTKFHSFTCLLTLLYMYLVIVRCQWLFKTAPSLQGIDTENKSLHSSMIPGHHNFYKVYTEKQQILA